MTLLSVITVVRDDPEGFRRTRDSLERALTADTLPEAFLEWLVIDGSHDAGLIPALVQDSRPSSSLRPRVEWCEPRGIYPAMNDGLERARGQYAWFLNAGDAIHSPESLHDIRDTVAEAPDWAVGEVNFVSSDGMSTLPEPLDYPRERARYFAAGRFPPHQGTVVRVETAQALGGFDTRYRIAADYALMLRFALSSDPACSTRVWADFFEGGASTVQWRQSVREFHRARRDTLNLHGIDALREQGWTMRQYAAQGLARGLTTAARRVRGASQR